MQQQLLAILAVAVGIAVFGAFFWWVFRQKRRIRESFEHFGKAHGLDVQRGSFPTALGDLESGRFFSIGAKVHRTPTGRPQLQQVPDFWVQAGVLGEVPAGIVAGKRGRLQGKGPVQTGDADFDKQVWVDCPDPEAARAYLTPERRKALLDMADLDATLVGPRDENIAMVVRKTRGYTPRLEWLEERYEEFTGVAKRLDA